MESNQSMKPTAACEIRALLRRRRYDEIVPEVAVSARAFVANLKIVAV